MYNFLFKNGNKYDKQLGDCYWIQVRKARRIDLGWIRDPGIVSRSGGTS